MIDNAHLLGTAALHGTTGTTRITIPPGSPPTIGLGTHTVTAIYGGDTLYNTSTSTPASFTVAAKK